MQKLLSGVTKEELLNWLMVNGCSESEEELNIPPNDWALYFLDSIGWFTIEGKHGLYKVDGLIER